MTTTAADRATLLAAARDLADRGWRVFPLVPGGKRPAFPNHGADRCDGTLTKVRRGRVAVRDFRRKRTVIVRAGKSYLAKAPG